MTKYKPTRWLPDSTEGLIAVYIIILIVTTFLIPFLFAVGCVLIGVWFYLSQDSRKNRKLKKERESIILYAKYLQSTKDLPVLKIKEFTNMRSYHQLQRNTESFIWYDSFEEFAFNRIQTDWDEAAYIPSKYLVKSFWVCAKGYETQYILVTSDYKILAVILVIVNFKSGIPVSKCSVLEISAWDKGNFPNIENQRVSESLEYVEKSLLQANIVIAENNKEILNKIEELVLENSVENKKLKLERDKINRESKLQSFLTDTTIFSWGDYVKELDGNLLKHKWSILNQFNLDFNAKILSLEKTYGTVSNDFIFLHIYAVVYEDKNEIILISPESEMILESSQVPRGIAQLHKLPGVRLKFDSVSEAISHAEHHFVNDIQWKIKRYENE